MFIVCKGPGLFGCGVFWVHVGFIPWTAKYIPQRSCVVLPSVLSVAMPRFITAHFWIVLMMQSLPVCKTIVTFTRFLCMLQRSQAKLSEMVRRKMIIVFIEKFWYNVTEYISIQQMRRDFWINLQSSEWTFFHYAGIFWICHGSQLPVFIT